MVVSISCAAIHDRFPKVVFVEILCSILNILMDFSIIYTNIYFFRYIIAKRCRWRYVCMLFSATLSVSILFLNTLRIAKTTLPTNLPRPIWNVSQRAYLDTDLFVGLVGIFLQSFALFFVVFFFTEDNIF